MKDKQFELLMKAYKLTDNVTPQRFDCGKLCNAACCKNLSSLSEKTGMQLLPYEKAFLEINAENNYTYIKSGTTDVLICDGNCNRKFRPFACRIFPYYASVTDTKISLKKDPRAASVCPLLLSKVYKRPNIFFLRNMKRAIRLLVSVPEIQQDLVENSEFIDSLYELYSKIK